MEILLPLLGYIANGAGNVVGTQAVSWLIERIRQFFREKPASVGMEVLKELGATKDGDIRRLVENVLGKEIGKERLNEVVGLIQEMARGARMLNSQGRPRSSYLRCSALIEQLLEGLRTNRKRGESVSQGHEWVLKQFLGKGSFGEVWLAVHPKAPVLEPRAYKFFTLEDAQEWLERESETIQATMAKLRPVHLGKSPLAPSTLLLLSMPASHASRSPTWPMNMSAAVRSKIGFWKTERCVRLCRNTKSYAVWLTPSPRHTGMGFTTAT